MKRRFALPVLAAVGLAALTGAAVGMGADSAPLPHYPTWAAHRDLALAGRYEPIVTTVSVADRDSVPLNPAACATDVKASRRRCRSRLVPGAAPKAPRA